jgi:hypothetical protein
MRNVFGSFAIALGLVAPPEIGRAEGRALNVGIGAHAFLQDSFGKPAPRGFSVPLDYEYELKPTFNLGIHLGYRFSGEISQLTYGLLLKHYFHEDPATIVRPYLKYGLLFLVSRLEGREGAGTSHDTHLCAGTDFAPWGADSTLFFAEVGYHFSALSYFEESAGRLDVIQVAIGPRWRF